MRYVIQPAADHQQYQTMKQRQLMTVSERFQRAMAFEPVDRLPVIEWAPWWDQTVNAWRGQGLPEHLKRVDQIAEWFGLDPVNRVRVRPCAMHMPRPAQDGACILPTPDDAGYDAVRPHLFPDHSFDHDEATRISDRRNRGESIVWVVLNGFFWFPRTLFGIEQHFMAFYDTPDLMHRINHDLQQHSLSQIDVLLKSMSVDMITFAEDLSYNHGPMLSRQLFDAFIAPYYRPIIDRVHESGALVFVDSDGLIDEVAAWFLDAGVDGTLPLERRAGTDVVALAKRHPRLRMVGGFDKNVIADGDAAIGAELEYLKPAACRGGFIPSVDHQTPPQVTIDQYRMYVALLREFCESVVR